VGDLTTLAHEFLIGRGALVERYDDADSSSLEAILPSDLAQTLRLNEHVMLVEGAARSGAARLAYGTELLERLVALACESVPVAFAWLQEPLASRPNVADVAMKRMTGLNCVLRLSDGACIDGWAGYLALDYRYAANADERREGLVRVVINEESGAHIAALSDIDRHGSLHYGIEGALPPLEAEVVLARAGKAAQWVVKSALTSFGASVVRRHMRDRGRLKSYYSGLAAEMQSQLERLRARGGSPEELSARSDKLAGLEPALERKLRDLGVRYVLRVELSPVAALRVAVAVRRASIKLVRKQTERSLVIEYNAVTRTIDPLACEACGASIYSFAACDRNLHLLCATCDAARPSTRSCPVCEHPRV
jgi:hypothetical protein